MCRVFKKRVTTMRKVSEHDSSCWYDEQVSFMQDLDSPKQTCQSNLVYQQLPYPCKKELDLPPYQLPRDHFLQLPLLESPKLLQSASAIAPINNPMEGYVLDHVNHSTSLLPPFAFVGFFIRSHPNKSKSFARRDRAIKLNDQERSQQPLLLT